MSLSQLQKFILIKCYNSKSFRVNRIGFLFFYRDQGRAKADMRTKIITQSVESLIDRELMIGYGVRTAHKWFIREVSLTDKGKKEARRLLGEQLSLPWGSSQKSKVQSPKSKVRVTRRESGAQSEKLE